MARAPSAPSRDQISGNGYLDQNYRARDEAVVSDYRDYSRGHDKRPSTASSIGSADHEADDLLSPNDLKEAKRMHGARNVIEAFSQQVEKRSNQQARLVRSPPMNASDSLAVPSMFHDQSYPRTPGFGEIERVLQKIKLHWDFTGIARASGEDESFANSNSSTAPFSAVGLALDLLEAEVQDVAHSAKRAKDMINNKGRLTPSLSSFLKLQTELEKALQLTIQGNYRQFDASVNSYKLTKASVDSNFRKIGELKSKLIECRTTLGTGSPFSSFNNAVGGKGTELKVLQARREVLREMLKLIDTIERLKQVPERLESLISSKSFLSATVLLVRSLKVINKPELSEIGGLGDLRSYLVNQESVIFEILIEELHNHLYSKNYFCNSKWRAYRPGQVTLPVIHARDEPSPDPFEYSVGQASIITHPPSWAPLSSTYLENTENSDALSTSIPCLQNYLNDLMTQPQSNPLEEEADLFLELASSSHNDNEVTKRLSITSSGLSKKRRNQPDNPEADSFKYIEGLIESFAVLGKLSLGLDTVLQRVPIEIYTLVENTMNEVDERHETTKRFFRPSASNRNSLKSNMNMIILLITTRQTPMLAKQPLESPNDQANLRFSLFKFNSNELKEIESIAQVLQDFFWTLYSKLDATLQSFRVLHEVSLRISERKSFKEEGMKSNLVLFSLLEVWKPIQSELLALIHAYLTDSGEDQFSSTDKASSNTKQKASTTSMTRNPIASIAEVLKFNISGNSSNNLSGAWKDSNKQLFKFKDTGIKQNHKDFKTHETNLSSALRASVPGLVLDSKVANPNSNGTIILTTGSMTDDSSGAGGNSNHRLLVQPDAFHIAQLFKPTLEFLKRAREVLPSGVVIVSNSGPLRSPTQITNGDEVGGISHHREDWDEDSELNLAQFDGFSGFLDDFVLHTFLPQLEEKVVHLFERSVNAPDAFQSNTTNRIGPHVHSSSASHQRKPAPHVSVAKSLATVVALIECLGNLVHSTAFHQEKCGRLMISIVVQYYQKCRERFKEMVVRESTEMTATVDETNPHINLKLPADLAQKEDVIRCLRRIKILSSNDTTPNKLLKKLSKIEEQYLPAGSPLALKDLIQSPKKVAALAHLYNTLLSFVSFIRRLASTVKAMPHSEGQSGPENELIESEWVADFGPLVKPENSRSSLRLPLTYALMRRLQLAHQSFSTLAQTILFTIYLELRLDVQYYIDQAFSCGNYCLSKSDTIEPDPQISELNSLLRSYSDNSIIPNLMRMNDRKFLFISLFHLQIELMVSNVKKLTAVTRFGFEKLSKNAVALQQNMKSVFLSNRLYYNQSNQELHPITEGSNSQRLPPVPSLELNFERCRKFWEMASHGPQAVMASIRSGDNYSFEEFRKLLELVCLSDASPTTEAERTNQQDDVHQDDSDFNRLSLSSFKCPNVLKSPSLDKRKRIYNECLIELHAVVMDDEDDDEDDELEANYNDSFVHVQEADM